MCGIAGYFGIQEIPPDRVESALSLLRRRGPDHAAARRWTGPAGRRALLLHTRLGIIDLDPRANQPFRAGAKWIAFNGELYNYVELRRELEADGLRFETSSDTEVLLRALDRRGWGALDAFEGMWAFAVYDESDGSLTLCRDRFGEKPLYLLRDPDGLYFASEVKAIRALRGRPLTPNLDQVRRYLVNGYKSLYKGRETFHREISELPPGTLLQIRPDATEESRRYWGFRFDPDPGMTRAQAVEGVRDRLIRSVRLRLRADVPLAFCLSGGVDSNALIGIAKRSLGYDVHGFTIEEADPRYDERPFVRETVEALGLRHTVVRPETRGFLEGLRTLVAHHDAPVCTINYYAHWTLQRQIAASGYRVAVSGTGADELFSGYYDHHLAYLRELQGDPGAAAAARAAWSREVLPWVRNPHLRDPDLFIRDPAFRGHVYLNSAEFATHLTGAWSEPFAETAYTDDLLRNRMLNELFHEAVPVILHEDDLNAMYWSVENRSPYLDRELFEFTLRIPTRHLVHEGRAKSILRGAVRGLVPDQILDNPRKVGFNAPIESYLDARDPAVRDRLFAPGPLFDVVRRDRFEELLGR